MAGASLLALLDDITALLDDVALMTKTAASKTAGVLGDDLAVNAEQTSGVKADRELPVVWAVAKGSMVNKCIIVPIAMLLSFFMPWLILPILMLGGLYLCFEGAEKVFGHHEVSKYLHDNIEMSAEQLLLFEKDKIKGAIRTDFVLSIEIIVITLGTVASANLLTQFGVLALIAFVATVGVYGIVALIVKLDDMGLYLLTQSKAGFVGKFNHTFGHALVNSAPYLMKLLTVVGTIAMFLVGGGILSHSIHTLALLIETITNYLSTFMGTLTTITWLVELLHTIVPLFLNGLLGMLAGTIVLLIVPKVRGLFS